MLSAAESDSAARSEPARTQPTSNLDVDELRGRIVEALKSVYDPEIPVDIWELGLIYEINIAPTGKTHLVMTLTAPNCPVAGTLPLEAEGRVAIVPGVRGCEVEITWDPPWTRERMSEEARLALDML